MIVKIKRNKDNIQTGYVMIRNEETWFVPLNDKNNDYQLIQEWIAEGNEPEEAYTITDNGGSE